MESVAPAAEQKMNFPRFLLALIVNPKQAFTQLDQTGKPHFLWAALIMLAVVWLCAVAVLPITQRETEEGFSTVMEQTSGTSAEIPNSTLEQQKAFMTNPIYLVASQGITGTIGYVILWASAAGVLYLFDLAFGGQARFGSVLSMTVWASMIEALGRITLTVGTLAMGRSAQPGLSYLVPTGDLSNLSPVTAALSEVLSKISIFGIWYIVLIGVGIVVCAKVTRAKGALIAVLYWLVSLIPPVAMAAAGAAIATAFMG
jgi:hypothetical protein